MERRASGSCLSAIFIDYDNIYLSLRRKDEEAARRFAREAPQWLREIESGRLITPTNNLPAAIDRRIVMNRCYGNPVARRNSRDNATDQASFPFVRHHFLRAGCEVVDCPPLTQQLKNSSDIRMVMDIRDFLTQDTYYDEFIILSGDADFTPVLHRLRAHARRTVVYANEYTAVPYTALCDGEIREADLCQLLLKGTVETAVSASEARQNEQKQAERLSAAREDILDEVVASVRRADGPVPIETLADNAQRAVGHDRTIGTNWAGSGTFRNFLTENLPSDIELNNEPPFFAYDPSRHELPEGRPAGAWADKTRSPQRTAHHVPETTSSSTRSSSGRPDASKPATPREAFLSMDSEAAIAAMRAMERERSEERLAQEQSPSANRTRSASGTLAAAGASPMLDAVRAAVSAATKTVKDSASGSQSRTRPPTPQHQPPQSAKSQVAGLQNSIGRIREACQAPALSPAHYRRLFELLALELEENGPSGTETVDLVTRRAVDDGIEIARDDIRFIIDVVSEADPWFEKGVSANLFAGRFRNFAVARCRSQGLNLTAEELDLVDAWFVGPAGGRGAAARNAGRTSGHLDPVSREPTGGAAGMSGKGDGNRPPPQSIPNRDKISQPLAEPDRGTLHRAASPVLAREPVALADDQGGLEVGDLPRFVRSRMWR